MDSKIKGVSEEPLVSAVYERIKPELDALEPGELLHVSLDVAAAIATVFGVLPEVKALRPQIVKELPAYDIARFDKLEDYALALSYTQANYLAAIAPPDDLEALTADCSRMRELLLAEAKTLILRGLLGEGRLEQLKGANGYKNLATDVLVLTSVMQAVWAEVEGKILTTRADLETASRLGTRLMRVVGLREQGPTRIADATALRQRAFTLLFGAYEHVRRAVTYLRTEHDDADEVAPALHPGRPRRRPRSEEPPPPAPAAPAPVTPSPSNGTAAKDPSRDGPFV